MFDQLHVYSKENEGSFYVFSRSLLTGHNALLLQQIARDLLHALSHRHDSTWTAFVEPVVSTGGNKLIKDMKIPTVLRECNAGNGSRVSGEVGHIGALLQIPDLDDRVFCTSTKDKTVRMELCTCQG